MIEVEILNDNQPIGTDIDFDGRFFETALDNIIAAQEALIKSDIQGHLPDYWETYLPDKIAAIKALQSKGGKDCFSFIVMTDLHYDSNLGKRSPLIAKRILGECDIKYVLCLGDVQTRGCHKTKDLLLAENEAIEEMLSPIRDRLLQTEGNHDGSFGFLDKDGDGELSNYDSEGSLKAAALRETYVYNLTPAELYGAIYRKVGSVGDVHFDESGSGYYVDDVAAKVRYIVLNTHANDYELQADGTSKYPKMWCFNFTQSQFDLLIQALTNIPSNDWGVVVAGHCPLFQEINDREIMQGVLNAYKNKTTYVGAYNGVATGVGYTNLADPSSSDWKDGHRISSSGISAQSGKTVCNPISIKTGDVIRIKGMSFVPAEDRYALYKDDALGSYDYISNLPNADVEYSLVDDVHEFTILNTDTSFTKFYVSFTTPVDLSEVIITKNEEIVATGHGYDYVSVNCDFSQAKGELMGYFSGHIHSDNVHTSYGFNVISTRCDAQQENTTDLQNERVAGTVTEQSFDVFTVNKATRTIYATKIGAGEDREIGY